MSVCEASSRLEALKGVALRLRETDKELQEAVDECLQTRESTGAHSFGLNKSARSTTFARCCPLARVYASCIL
jgi:hypothetical protein